jgi:hypothetical protein
MKTVPFGTVYEFEKVCHEVCVRIVDKAIQLNTRPKRES